MNTREQLIEATASLLDSGGENAVTLRAIAQAVGLSHNAPYKHFADRNDLLASVAIRELHTLTDTIIQIRQSSDKPEQRLRQALDSMIAYAQQFPARYHLLFSNLNIAERGGELEETAIGTFNGFAALIQDCQTEGSLPDVPNIELTGLIFATLHGLIDIQATGRMQPRKGLTGVAPVISLLLDLLAVRSPSSSHL